MRSFAVKCECYSAKLPSQASKLWNIKHKAMTAKNLLHNSFSFCGQNFTSSCDLEKGVSCTLKQENLMQEQHYNVISFISLNLQ